jgi:hypothetical protein
METDSLKFWLILSLPCLCIGIFGFLTISKKLRNDRTILILLTSTAIIAIYPLVLKILNTPFEGYLRTTDYLFSPFIYMLSYAVLRYLYKRTYNREPTYNRDSWYDEEEKRYQNIFDFIVMISPLFISGLFPIIIN